MKIKISIVGIEGLPNKYGGFETLANYLVQYLSKQFDLTVFCSSKDLSTNESDYNGAALEYIPISSHGWQGVFFDIMSLKKALNRSDVVLFLGFGAGIYFPFISRANKSKIILNFGGLDWQRSKWSFFTGKMIQWFEALMVMNVKCVIADNRKIADYVHKRYHKNPIEISYGGDQVEFVPIDNSLIDKFSFLNEKYACAVCRIQPDNNIELILEAFSRTNFSLVFIGNWSSSKFGGKCKQKYKAYKNIYMLDAIYDQHVLNMIRSNCQFYIHGHSAGGTNPSLLEAMHLGLNIFAYKSGYNEITSGYHANYFTSEDELCHLITAFKRTENDKKRFEMQAYAKEHYKWSDVASKYKELFLNVYQSNNVR